MRTETYKKINIQDNAEYDSFVDGLFAQFPFNDIYETETAVKIDKHHHKDTESRLFLEGSAFFKIGNTTYHCTPGTYIEIPAGISHSFEFSGPGTLRVLRFFSEHNNWTATFCENDI